MQFQYPILIVFLVLMSVLSFSIISSRDLLNSTILQGAFSLFSVIIYSLLRAPDVGMTEVSVGAAVSSVFAFLVITKIGKKVESHSLIYGENSAHADYWWVLKFLATMSFFVAMMAISLNFHDFGSVNNAISQGSDASYIKRTMREFGIEEIVTAVLGAYRGFDTMIETTVGFSAAFGMREILKKQDRLMPYHK